MSTSVPPRSPRRVAVVGSGVAGLVAAHVLARESHVLLLEADDRLGGHADTHEVDLGGRTVRVDTGFIVHNDRTYPTLLRLFEELGVATQDSDMSMSVRDDTARLEYAGARKARGLFPTWRNAANAPYVRMLLEVKKFHAAASALLAQPESADGGLETLGDFADRVGFSAYFRTHFLEPVVAAVWSCDPAVALRYPARYLFTFLDHHGMLTVFGSPTWRTVVGGSARYVERVAAGIQEIRTSSPVTSVRETADGVEVRSATGTDLVDAVVVATHPSAALGMLTDPTGLQRDVLGAIPYSRNTALLHTDESVLPRHAGARASWNYWRRPPGTETGRVLVTYDLTRLMRLDSTGPRVTDRRFLVTSVGRTSSTRRRSSTRWTTSTRSSRPSRSPRSAGCRRSPPTASRSRGRTTAGASTRTARCRACARPSTSAPPGTARPARPAGPTPSRWRPRHDRHLRHDDPARASRAGPARLHHPQLHVARRPRRPARAAHARPAGRLATFEPRDHLAADAPGSLREKLDAFLATQGVDLRGGRVLMLAQARVLGYVFNPISVYWCHRPDGGLECVVVEVHNTYGDRHAYLVRTDDHGRAQTGKELYVSPFNDVDGHYDLVLPEPDQEPGGHLRMSVVLQRAGRPPFVAVMSGRALAPTRSRVLRTALTRPLEPLAVMARIKAHGVFLWLRRLRCAPDPSTDRRPSSDRPRPAAHRPGHRPHPLARPRHRPSRLKRTVHARVAEQLFRRIADRFPVRVEWPDGRVTGGAAAEPDAPTMWLRAPERFFARVGDAALVGFGESYMAGEWDSPDLGAFLAVLAAEMGTSSPSRCSGFARSTSRTSRAARRTASPTPARTSRGTTTSATTCSRPSSTRR